MFKASYKIATVWGIPIKIHISLIFLLAFLAWRSGALGNWRSLFEILLLETIVFSSIALHELGHSFVALRKGVRVREITLMFMGGAAQMEEIPRKPADEFLMAIAGPAVSVALGWPGTSGRGACRKGLTRPGPDPCLAGIINFYLADSTSSRPSPWTGPRPPGPADPPHGPAAGHLRRLPDRQGYGRPARHRRAHGDSGRAQPGKLPPRRRGVLRLHLRENEYRMVRAQEAFEREGFGSWSPLRR